MSYIFLPHGSFSDILTIFMLNRHSITKIAVSFNIQYNAKRLPFSLIFQADFKMGKPRVYNRRMGKRFSQAQSLTTFTHSLQHDIGKSDDTNNFFIFQHRGA